MKTLKMKISRLCILMLAILMMLSSCSFGTNSAADGVVLNALSGGVSTDDGYFMQSNDGRMMFYDYKTKQLVPLCNKPDCRHEDPKSCAAYIGSEYGGSEGYTVCGGYIYYFVKESFTGIKIVRANLDNSDQITLAKDELSYIDRIAVIGNKIYYTCTFEIYEENSDIMFADSIGNIKSIHCFDSATNKVSTVVNSEHDAGRKIFFECASKDYIYFLDMRLGDETEKVISEFDGAEVEVNVKSEVKIKKLSLKTLEETVVADAMDICFDYGGFFVRKKGDAEFEVNELDFQTGELKKIFTIDTNIGVVASDKDRLMYRLNPADVLGSDCVVFDKRTKTSEEIHFSDSNGEDVSFSYDSEYGDYFIGVITYDDRQLKVMIKKDDVFNGKIDEYDLIYENEF